MTAAPALPQPSARRLRVYAFDPDAALELGSVGFSQATIALAWNDPTDEVPLSAGPVNDYLEVIDIDPSSKQFYAPLDLNAKEVLAQDGLTPSEGDPRFHQQMAFAVAMKTIKQFERALGRKILWAPEWDRKRKTYIPTPRLRVYPHALREANAYYSKTKRALLFGYFNASARSAGANWIFTVLSHDIIVHETTHAILDGLHPRYSEATSSDSLAFHEAFADIAALFSHFQLYEAVRGFIERQGGRLNQAGLLSGLASQFAKGTTGRTALRDFIDSTPNPDLLAGTTEPHARGAILVAAVFDAFLSIYTARTADLLRIGGAEPGSGGHLHPDLVARLATEAGKAADHVLRMCIRALDYLPPVDVRFGEFLRAIITADADLIPDDRLHYRLAFVEAFRRRGIFPEACLSMSPDNLLWDPAPQEDDEGHYLDTSSILREGLDLSPQFRRSEITATQETNRRKLWYWLVQPELQPKSGAFGATYTDKTAKAVLDTEMARARAALSETTLDDPATRRGALGVFIAAATPGLTAIGLTAAQIGTLEKQLFKANSNFTRWTAFFTMVSTAPNVEPDDSTDRRWEAALGIYFKQRAGKSSVRGSGSAPAVEVASVRTTRRAGPDGQDIRQLVIEVTQRRQGFFDPVAQAANDAAVVCDAKGEPLLGDFVFRGGATMIIDLRDGTLRYVIAKHIDDDARLDAQRQILLSGETMGFTYDRGRSAEPFALLHRM